MLDKMDRGELEVKVPTIKNQIERLELTVRRLVGALIFAAFLATGVQAYIAGFTTIGGLLLGAASITLTWVICTRS